MAGNEDNNRGRELADFLIPSAASCDSSVVRLAVDVNNFELKPSLIQLTTFDEANDLIELVATNQYMYSSERGVKKGVMEVHTADPLEAMAKQIGTMTKKLEKLEVAAVSPFGTTSLPCGLCGGPHDSQTCSFIMDDQSSAEQVNYVGN
ncbi:hypothetical protein PIB30_086946 [Stylosanthes scabra]|uniref:Uncharacterized protein n=1 Tax=Stylosanthes scabra TaxID=79078 RepID=A0ABU6UST9_9FABA|nr:hypothetical protein [Stylosanthes scabra]